MHDPYDDEFRALTGWPDQPNDHAPEADGPLDVPRDEREREERAAELVPGAVRRERLLGVPADEAWELLRDADGLSRWLADDVDVVVAPGERGRLRDDDGEIREVAIDEVEEGRRVALRWWTAHGEESLIDLVLDDIDGAGRLTVTEVPLQVIAIPDAVPASWTARDHLGGDDPMGGPSAGPQLRALACR